MLYQRKAASGISSMITKIASAAQRKSSSGIADETWRQSTCPETYQKHAPVTSSLAATIAAFSTPRRCDGRGVSKSLATLVLIRLRPRPERPIFDFTEACGSLIGQATISLQALSSRPIPQGYLRLRLLPLAPNRQIRLEDRGLV